MANNLDKPFLGLAPQSLFAFTMDTSSCLRSILHEFTHTYSYSDSDFQAIYRWKTMTVANAIS